MKIKQAIFSYIPNKIYFFKYYSNIMKELEQKLHMTEDELKIWQLDKINKELIYANTYVPYYKKIFKENKINLPLKSLEDLKRVPYLTKDIIRKYYEELISLKKIDSSVVNTGGSTGTPLRLEKSYFSGVKEQIFLDYYVQSLGIKSFKCRKAIIRGPIPKSGISEKIGNQLILSSYLISKKTIKKYIDELEKFNPILLHVYPSSIYMIAKLILDNKLDIKIKDLRIIFSSSEIFTREQKEIVYKVFKCKILDLYGNTENSVHAINIYPQFGYKFNPIYSYVEIGSDKEIITTTFDEKVMPLIRYRTGDEVEKIDSENYIIKGRTQDYIYGKSGCKYPVVGLIFGQHFSCFKEIEKFQIIQNKIGKINFLIESEKKLEELKENEVIETLNKATSDDLEVEIKYVNCIERTKRGKYKFLVQNISNLE